RLPQLKSKSQVVEVQAADDVKVRLSQPPPAYDDKGHFRTRTAQELKELKGPDPTLPGYAADWDDLKDGQTVTVRLARTEGAKEVAKGGQADPKADTTRLVPLGQLTGR